MQYRGFIFDMDGTLVDNMQYHNDSWFHFFEANGVDITPEEFDKKHKGNIIEVLQNIFGTDYPLDKLIALGNQKEQIYRDLYAPHVKAIDGLHDFLAQLKAKNYPIALATMGDWDNIDFIFNKLDIKHYFDVVIGGSDVKKGKPHPEIFLKAAEKLGIKPQEALVFEDSHSGIEAAKNAQMATVGIVSTLTHQELMEKKLYKVIHDYTALNLSLIS